MKLISQILPYVRKALKQNQHDTEAKELIRQIELSTTFSGAATAADSGETKYMQSRLEQLEEELHDLKEAH